MFVGAGSIDQLTREASMGLVNHAGSRAFGWFVLRGAQSTYTEANGGWDKLASDCAGATGALALTIG